MDTEQVERAETVRATCVSCAGTGYLRATSIKDPPTRACEYCDGRGWIQLIPFDPEVYWDA
jgi:DnaJ-class molecular chaperone